MSDTPSPSVTPPPLTVAASLVALQGLGLVGVAIVQVAELDDDRRALGLSNAGFYGAYGVLLLVAAWGLWRCSGWSRGPALLTQLIWLGLAWTVREHVVAAVALAVLALVVLAGILHPDSIESLNSEDQASP
ncbi:hypothetical protein [Nocardioides antri]|uniref:Uncharacterized protein n=1 Tax=Nocardioides antri TaxID=2607659 RepID=A0A5B1M8F2_9ACTN|nr:hypothetical protein [Nocardioides antri]KAA1428818.1 hypothetical protein F0U47_00935 [Nocardioides antri]